MFELRDYQREALDAVEEWRRKGVRRPLVSHPTGTGKTVTFCHQIARRDGRALVLVHRDELIGQTHAKIRQIAPELRVGVVKAKHDEHDADVVLASVQTLSRQARLDRVTRDFSTIIVDEAHHAAAPTWRRVLDHFEHPETLTVGFTATPERGDGIKLRTVFDRIVHQFTILEAIIEHRLCDLRGLQVGSGVDLSKVRTRGGDYAAGDLGDVFEAPEAISRITKGWLEHAADRKTIAFTPTVATAQMLADAVASTGHTAEMVSGATPEDERRGILARLKSGDTQFVANCAVLVEGFDEPSVDCILVARPTQSRPFYIQMVGRGTRKHPGKDDCLILDVTGEAARHGLVTVSDLGGLAPEKMKGKTLVEAVEHERRRRAAQVGLARETKTIDLFASKMRWLPVEDGHVLPAGEVDLIILPDGDNWQVMSRKGTKAAQIAQGLTMDYAQGYAEDVARRTGGSLSKQSARWLTMRPTDAQLRALRMAGLRDTSRVKTRGEASDLITRIKARGAIRRARRQEARS